MIEGFHDYTKPLTATEENVAVPLMVMMIKQRCKGGSSVTNHDIRTALNMMGVTVGEPRVRALIHYIRINNLVPDLIATSNGYKIAETKEELARFILSLEQRANSILAVRSAMLLNTQHQWIDYDNGQGTTASAENEAESAF